MGRFLDAFTTLMIKRSYGLAIEQSDYYNSLAYKLKTREPGYTRDYIACTLQISSLAYYKIALNLQQIAIDEGICGGDFYSGEHKLRDASDDPKESMARGLDIIQDELESYDNEEVERYRDMIEANIEILNSVIG